MPEPLPGGRPPLTATRVVVWIVAAAVGIGLVATGVAGILAKAG